VDHF
jgi:hypothetical protein